MHESRWLGLLLLIAITPTVRADAPKPTPAGLVFFEQKIRPVLVKHCYSCHSTQEKKSRGGLLLDTRAALLKGGDSGPAIEPGKPLSSLLLKAIRHDGLAMPPKDRLSTAIAADFEKWIAMGAPDPRDGSSTSAVAGIDLVKGKQFWAFQPPKLHTAPAVRDTAWPRSRIDRFLLAALEAKNVRPVGDASRTTLLRRVTLDLTGLPPTPDEIADFLADERPDALAIVVDRLLASPAFGERWGRHWLDVARYADSNGKDENLTFHEAYLFRDYVLASLNADKPFSQLVQEHVAGDLLPARDPAHREEQLTGTGFLVVGPKVLADRDQERRRLDVVDEQIDTVGKAFLGLTLGCARCHDHKFDPVPTVDYYALAGIFNSTRTLDSFKLGNPVVSGWMLRPVDAESEKRLAAQKSHEAKLKKLGDEIKKVKADLKSAEDRATMRVPGRLVGVVVDDADAKVIGAWKASTYSRPYVGAGYIHDDKTGKGEKSVVFTPKLPKAGEYEVFLSYVPGGSRAMNVPVTIQHAAGSVTVNVDQTKKPKLDDMFHSVGTYRFEAGSASSVTISNKDTTGHVIVDAVRWIPVGALAKEPEMAMGVPPDVKEKIASTKKRVAELEAQEKKLKGAAPKAPRLVMAVSDEAKPGDVPVAIRGNAHQPGANAPRGFVSVASWEKTPAIAKNQSGRLELAKWLADERNPLTARVMVNRAWMHLLGEGLVRSVDNFGVQGERPTHPELLDTLAVEFMQEGWSVKSLVRKIVLSRVYGLSVGRSDNAAKVDPENRLLWRAHRRRLQAEVIRDGILSVAGTLERTVAGTPVPGLPERAITNESTGGVPTDSNRKRSVYLPVIRNDVPPIFEVFDFADPDVTTGRRDTTTVATQALYLLNSPFVLEQAREAAKRLLAEKTDNAERLTLLYRRALGRTPSPDETKLALAFVGQGDQNEAWATVCQAVFGCTEFRFVE